MKSFASRFVLVSAFLAAISVAPPAEATPVLYGITFDNQLITIDTATGAGTLVGNLSSSMAAFGLAALGNNLYTFDQSADLLRQLNPNTGATIASINLGLGDLAGEGGVDFRSDGVGFLSSAGGTTGTIYSFTTTPNSGSLLGNTAASLDGLAFSAGGVLFGLGQTNGNLYTVNQTTGALTLIGPTGVTDHILGGLDFIGPTLYAGFSNASAASSLYQVNTSTGAATLIGNVGFNQLSGLASIDTDAVATVPEPASLLLVGTGLIGAGVRRYRQRRSRG